MINSKDQISTQFMHRSLLEISTKSEAERLKGDPYIGIRNNEIIKALETLEHLCLIQTIVRLKHESLHVSDQPEQGA